MLLNLGRRRMVSPFQFGGPARVYLGLIVTAAITTIFLGSEPASILLAVTMPIGLLGAGASFVRRSRALQPKERRAWSLIGAGFLIAGTGVLGMALTLAVNPDLQAFGPLDLTYLTGYAVGMVGFVSLPHTHGTGLQRLRLLFDGLIGAIAVATLLWVVFLNEVTAALGDAPTWQRLVGSIYVLVDVSVVVTVMIVVVRRSNLRFDLRLVLFACGAILFTAADVAFLISAAGRSFTEAEPIYALYMLAMALFLATALIVDRAPAEKEYAERARTPLWAMALPYGSAAVMVALLVTRAPGIASSSDAGLLYATLAIGGLVIARQAVAIRENRRLVEAQQSALVTSISHELRTPLTAMVGFLELLEAGAITDPAERNEMTSIVSEQASHLGRIVSDLVMLASEKIATMDLDISPTAIDDLAWAAIGNAAVDAGSVRVHAQRGVVAYVDPGRMKQALANLLGNAARYGGEKVLVVAKAEAGNLLMEVHDDGPGVPRKYELLIWERFERGPNRLNSTVPGSGIGLAVTDLIAKAHGGSAGYRRSERLGGACFWMRLPGRVHGQDLNSSGAVTRLNVVDSSEDARSA